jgi:hypothetical protein
MKKLLYTFNLRSEEDNREFNSTPDEYIGLYLEQSARTACPWHRALQTLADTRLSVREHYSNIKHKFFAGEIDRATLARGLEPVAATAKVCPAITGVLENSYLVKTPSEIHISIDSSGDFLANSASKRLLNIMAHPAKQYVAEGSELFKDSINLKFELPVLLNSSRVPYVFLQPSYHTPMDWVIPPGAIWGRETLTQQLNVNTFFRIPESGVRDIHIRAGTVLAYIWFPEPLKLEYSNRIQRVDVQQRYLGADKFFYRDK